MEEMFVTRSTNASAMYWWMRRVKEIWESACQGAGKAAPNGSCETENLSGWYCIGEISCSIIFTRV
jgi:hypothetical protein